MARWKLDFPKLKDVPNAEWCELRVQSTSDPNHLHRLVFVRVKPGKYVFGSRENENTFLKEKKDDGIVESEFWIASFETPNALYHEYRNANKKKQPANKRGKLIDKRAIGPFSLEAASDVSPEQAKVFLRVLNKSKDEFSWINMPANMKALSFRLPTPGEFELATRAKSETEYYFGSPDRSEVYVGLSSKTRLGYVSCQFPPNGFGLHDSVANLSEWVDFTALAGTAHAAKSPSDNMAIGSMTSDYSAIYLPGFPSFAQHGFRAGIATTIREPKPDKEKRAESSDSTQ